MPTIKPHIRYANPYGGHPILRKDPHDALAAVLVFLRVCTDWNGRWKDVHIDVAPTGGAFLPKSWDAEAVKTQLGQKVGRARIGITTISLGSLQSLANPRDAVSSPNAEVQATWDVPPKRHAWAIDLVLSQPKPARGHPDPVSLTASADFRLRALPPNNGASGKAAAQVLPGQDARSRDALSIRSSLMLHLSTGNTSAFFDLVLPFAQPDQAFIDYVSRLRPHLPIRIAKGNFKLYTPKATAAVATKAKKAYKPEQPAPYAMLYRVSKIPTSKLARA